MNRVIILIGCLLFFGRVEAGLNDSATFKAAQNAQSKGEYGQAYSLFKAEAEASQNPLAYFSLGLYHRNGWARNRDQSLACSWFDKAAQGGMPYAQHLYAKCLEEGSHVPVNIEAAIHWYQKAVESGYSLSNCHLGQLYMTGQGVKKDPTKALQLCHSAVQSSSVAMVWMGRFFLEGDESIRNNEQAYRWFEAASKKEQPEANYYLGKMIASGVIKELSYQDARYRYEKAAEKGLTKAYFPTAQLYFNAPAAPGSDLLSAHDLAKAYLWLSVTQKLSQDKVELLEVEKMLQQVLKVMPESWLTDLNQKIRLHIEERSIS